VVLTATPGSGQLGTAVVLAGTNLRGHVAQVVNVTLAGIPAVIVAENDTVVEVTCGDNDLAAVGDVVLTADTGATTTSANGWRYVSPGTINTVSPGSGQVGTRVTISGTGLLNGGNSIASAELAGVNVSSIVSSSETTVVVVAAAGTAQTGDVFLVQTRVPR